MLYLHLICWTGPPYQSHWGPLVAGMEEALTPSCAQPHQLLVVIYLFAFVTYPSVVSYLNVEHLNLIAASPMNSTNPFLRFLAKMIVPVRGGQTLVYP